MTNQIEQEHEHVVEGASPHCKVIDRPLPDPIAEYNARLTSVEVAGQMMQVPIGTWTYLDISAARQMLNALGYKLVSGEAVDPAFRVVPMDEG